MSGGAHASPVFHIAAFTIATPPHDRPPVDSIVLFFGNHSEQGRRSILQQITYFREQYFLCRGFRWRLRCIFLFSLEGVYPFDGNSLNAFIIPMINRFW
jgi:hypothetical protein